MRVYSSKPEIIRGVYERLQTPSGWIVCNTSSGHMIEVSDKEHEWHINLVGVIFPTSGEVCVLTTFKADPNTKMLEYQNSGEPIFEFVLPDKGNSPADFGILPATLKDIEEYCSKNVLNDGSTLKTDICWLHNF